MGLPKRKKDIKVYGVNQNTDVHAIIGRRKELLEASRGAVSKGKGAFDLSHLLKSKDGSNIDNQLGTCISGNNVVISCDGQTVRIDLDLATLLSTCADSFTQSALNGIGKKDDKSEEDGGGGGDEEEDEDDEGDEEEDDEGDEEEDDEGDEEEEDEDAGAGGGKGSGAGGKGSGAGSGLGGKGASGASPVVLATPAAAAAAKTPTATAVEAKYTAYDAEYQQFKRDPVVKYLDYYAEYEKFLEDATAKGLLTGTEF